MPRADVSDSIVSRLEGRYVTVMGLGLHGGGLATALFLFNRGARVTVTDLRGSRVLAPTVEQLPEGIRVVLGEHREVDFRSADLVVKNPAVPRTVQYLEIARAITTDIALFLAEWRRRTGADRGALVGVTGTKGKSSTAAATAALLTAAYPRTRLGGNITVSPLSFVDDLEPGDPVVLELSSFQLGDLNYCREKNAGSVGGAGPLDSASATGYRDPVLYPQLDANVGIVTPIFTDHQDYYSSMEDYVQDKVELLRHLHTGGLSLVGSGEAWETPFRTVTEERSDVTTKVVGEELPGLLPRTLNVPGAHMRRNLYAAALAAQHLLVPQDKIRDAAAAFSGVPHRLEKLGERSGIVLVNDTAATVPEAALAAIRSFPPPLVLIAGGSDKGLDLTPIVTAAAETVREGGAVVLLAGTATERLQHLLRDAGVEVSQPENSLCTAFARAVTRAVACRRRAGGRTATILLSPGCASFGMFRNEFDRGDQFRDLAERFLSAGTIPVCT